MYLAKQVMSGKTLYFIRESYQEGPRWKSRDIFELGEDPSAWIHYPGGVGYYIHDQVEEALRSKGIDASQEELEKIFLPFLAPEVRKVIRQFPGKGSKRGHRRYSRRELTELQKEIHVFDKRRIGFLRSGASDPRKVPFYPLRLYNRLLQKSRDEIEQMFEEREARLPPGERKQYIYFIFDLSRHFTSPLATDWPQAMDPDKMDRAFLEEICRYQEDRSLFPESTVTRGLHPCLVRYVIQYYDNEFLVPDWEGTTIEDFIRRHRVHPRFARQSPQLSVKEACKILAIPEQDFKGLGPKQLAQHYRQKALACHPDQGGTHERFIRLTRAYKDLLARKSSFVS